MCALFRPKILQAGAVKELTPVCNDSVVCLSVSLLGGDTLMGAILFCSKYRPHCRALQTQRSETGFPTVQSLEAFESFRENDLLLSRH